TLALVVFGASYLVRVSLQRGLDLPSMDWAAGAFHDRTPSQLRLGLCLGWKYLAAELLVLAASVGQLPKGLRRGVAFASGMAFFGRGAVNAALLFVCRSSYWTSFRALGDFGPSLLMAIAAAMAWHVVARADEVVGRPTADEASAA